VATDELQERGKLSFGNSGNQFDDAAYYENRKDAPKGAYLDETSALISG
jgi:hypothetical protein